MHLCFEYFQIEIVIWKWESINIKKNSTRIVIQIRIWNMTELCWVKVVCKKKRTKKKEFFLEEHKYLIQKTKMNRFMIKIGLYIIFCDQIDWLGCTMELRCAFVWNKHICCCVCYDCDYYYHICKNKPHSWVLVD